MQAQHEYTSADVYAAAAAFLNEKGLQVAEAKYRTEVEAHNEFGISAYTVIVTLGCGCIYDVGIRVRPDEPGPYADRFFAQNPWRTYCCVQHGSGTDEKKEN